MLCVREMCLLKSSFNQISLIRLDFWGGIINIMRLFVHSILQAHAIRLFISCLLQYDQGLSMICAPCLYLRLGFVGACRGGIRVPPFPCVTRGFPRIWGCKLTSTLRPGSSDGLMGLSTSPNPSIFKLQYILI